MNLFARWYIHSVRCNQAKLGLNTARCGAALHSIVQSRETITTVAGQKEHANPFQGLKQSDFHKGSLKDHVIFLRELYWNVPGHGGLQEVVKGKLEQADPASLFPRKFDIGGDVIQDNRANPEAFDLDELIASLTTPPKVATVSPDIPIEDLATLAIKSVAGGTGLDDSLNRPIAMVDLDKLRSQFDLWSKRLPHVKPYYAMKCNPDEEIVRCLANLGTNFDCASRNEIQRALSVGVDPQRIIFAHPIKFRSDLQFAREAGVKLMTFDSMNELHKIKQVYGPDAELLLRLHTDDEGSLCPLSIKFGSEGRSNWERLLQTAHDLELPLKGVSFHIGSGSTKPGGFTAALNDAREVFEMARSKFPNSHGRSMSILDIGGGFPGETGNEHFDRITSEITRALDKMAYLGLEVIGEPGRFFAQQSTTLVTQVLGVTEVATAVTKTGEGSAQVCYFLSDGVYGSFGDIVYYPDTKFAQPIPLFRDDGGHVKLSTAKGRGSSMSPALLFGPTCDGIDQLGTYSLPEMRERDYLVWEDMGAYTQCGVTNFNGISLPKAWYFERSTTQTQ